MVKDGWSQSPAVVERNTEQETTSVNYSANSNSKSYMYDTGSTNHLSTATNSLSAVNVWGVYETKENFMDMHFC